MTNKTIAERRIEQDAGSTWESVGSKTFRLIEEGGEWRSGAHRSKQDCHDDYRLERARRRRDLKNAGV